MSKVGGSYDSVVFGVSEQVAHDRRPGQHEEQINMLSDPVHGLSRRRGSVWMDEMEVLEGALADYAVDAGAMREFSFVIDGVEYVLLFRNRESIGGPETFMFLYNKTTDKFMPIVYENTAWVDELIAGGASCMAGVGRYIYIAGRTTIPEIEIENKWDTEENLQHMVAWIRGGAYSRTFSLTLTKDDATTVTVSYTTKPSSYPTLLDVTDIDFFEPDGTTPRPDYQKDINDRVYAYNSQVNVYIGEAAEDITPENIAQKLVDALVLAGVTATRQDGTVLVDDPAFIDISGDDGGDNTLIRAVGKEVSAPTLMSTIHYVGKIVRIRPQGASDSESYYLEAFAKGTVGTGWTEVVWRESAGVVQTPTRMFAEAIIEDGTMYVAQDGAGLEILAPTSGEHPDYRPNVVGDAVSAPTPSFFDRPITMLTVFQDRLLVGSDGVVSASRPGDYLNFFRHTVLNVQDNDPIDMFAYGSEGDVLRSAVMYDKDLLIFGDKKQYGITGRSVLSAKSPNIMLVSANADATSAFPVASGNFVFYGKNALGDVGDIRTTLHQIQTGQALTETPVSHEVSQQLDQYIQGTPAQLVALTAPNLILYRTEELANSVYTYTYVDDSGGTQRIMDSWSRWDFNPILGRLTSVSQYKGSILIFSMRQAGDMLVMVADKQSVNSELGALPYLDSMKLYEDVSSDWHATVLATQMSVAVDKTSDYFLLGTRGDKVDDLIEQLPGVESALWYGAVSNALVIPTNPYLRDSKGKAILSGRMTITQAVPSVTNTSGLTASVETVNGTIVTTTFQGRVMGLSSNLIARQPRPTTQVKVGIGREVREFKYTLASKDWLPLTITAIEWTGQVFNRVRRS